MTFALTAMTHVMAAHSASTAVKGRSPWAIVGLNLITLGFYSVYWWYVTNRDLRDLGRSLDAPGLQKEPALSALAFLFGGLLVVPLVWTAVTTSRRIRLAQDLFDTTRFLQVWIPVALLVVASLLVRLSGGASGAALAAVLAAALVLKSAAISYLQVSLNEVWQTCNGPVERPSEPVATLHAPVSAQV